MRLYLGLHRIFVIITDIHAERESAKRARYLSARFAKAGYNIRTRTYGGKVPALQVGEGGCIQALGQFAHRKDRTVLCTASDQRRMTEGGIGLAYGNIAVCGDAGTACNHRVRIPVGAYGIERIGTHGTRNRLEIPCLYPGIGVIPRFFFQHDAGNGNGGIFRRTGSANHTECDLEKLAVECCIKCQAEGEGGARGTVQVHRNRLLGIAAGAQNGSGFQFYGHILTVKNRHFCGERIGSRRQSDILIKNRGTAGGRQHDRRPCVIRNGSGRIPVHIFPVGGHTLEVAVQKIVCLAFAHCQRVFDVVFDDVGCLIGARGGTQKARSRQVRGIAANGTPHSIKDAPGKRIVAVAENIVAAAVTDLCIIAVPCNGDPLPRRAAGKFLHPADPVAGIGIGNRTHRQVIRHTGHPAGTVVRVTGLSIYGNIDGVRGRIIEILPAGIRVPVRVYQFPQVTAVPSDRSVIRGGIAEHNCLVCCGIFDICYVRIIIGNGKKGNRTPAIRRQRHPDRTPAGIIGKRHGIPIRIGDLTKAPCRFHIRPRAKCDPHVFKALDDLTVIGQGDFILIDGKRHL